MQFYIPEVKSVEEVHTYILYAFAVSHSRVIN